MDSYNSFQKNFSLITTGVVVSIGIPGNIIVLFVFTREHFRKIPMFRYFTASTLFETVNILLYWPLVSQSINENSIFCKSVQFFSYSICLNISWIGMLIALDRYLSIKYPLKFKIRYELKFQILIIIGIFVLSVILNIPFVYYYDIISKNSTSCDIVDDKVNLYLNIFDFITSTLMPFLIMLISTSLIGYYLIKNKMKYKEKKLEKEKQLIKVLFSMDIFFFFCYCPYSVYAIISAFDLLETSTSISDSVMSTFYYVANFILTIYCSFGFFMHLICNIQFRKYFFAMISLKKDKNRMQSSHETTNL